MSLPLLAANVGGASFDSLGSAAAVFVVLFALSFFFSGTETALFRMQKVDRQKLATEDSATARRITALLDRSQPLITTVLIGNETTNIAIAATGAALVTMLAPDKPWLNIVLLTPALVMFSEITPKVIAFRFNVMWSRAAVWPLSLFYVLVSPIRVVVAGVVGGLARVLFQVRGGSLTGGLEETELVDLASQGEEAGNLVQTERELLEAVFELDDLSVSRLMTPRPDVFALELETPWEDLIAAVREAGYSRIPIYSGSEDQIEGVLLVKDLLRHREVPPGPLQLRSLLMPAVYVPASKSADQMLAEFLERKTHIAFVVDEHGTFTGIITLDDLLSELVGELLDDGDVDTEDVDSVHPGRLAVRANMDIEDFEEETGIVLPEGEYHTVGGFVFHELGRLPQEGDTVEVHGHRFQVGEMDGRRIAEVYIDLEMEAS
ncbi:MAG: HlyC/CorC family transporter [Deltaproteobacteria bacterium]|nr:MAG: HlyC/CorC family transporter [Deltaproteobacteria bacterium]